MKELLLALLRAYRYLLSPLVGGSCRYWPTCSEYSREAIEEHGAARGAYMTIARLARCHPYGSGGVDPVPARFRWRCWCGEETGAAAASGPARTQQGGQPRTSEQ